MMRDTNDEPIKNVLKQFMDGYNHKPKVLKAKIVSSWESLMGKTIDSYTKDIQVHNQKMYIYIDSSPLRQELSYAKDKIKKLVNEELGEEYIKQVIIR